MHGYQKLTMMGPDAVAEMLAGLGIPLAGVMAWVVILVELLGGIALILGIGTRHFSLLLAIIMTVAILKVKLAKGWGEYNYDLILLTALVSYYFLDQGHLRLKMQYVQLKRRRKTNNFFINFLLNIK